MFIVLGATGHIGSELVNLLDAAGDTVTRAVGHAMLAATSTTTAAGTIRSYRDALR